VPPIVKTTPALPLNGGSTVTAVPTQVNLTTFGRTTAPLQGSDETPAPWYTQPVEPGGLPSPFHPEAGRLTSIGGEPLFWVSTMFSVAPLAVGGVPGRSTGSSGSAVADILATLLPPDDKPIRFPNIS
jgi:hypothetical protein